MPAANVPKRRPSAASLAEIPEIDPSRVRPRGRGLGKHRTFELRTIRAAVGKTQEDVADVAAMDQGDVSRIENRGDMRLSTLERYVRALGGRLQVSMLIGGRQYILDVGEAERARAPSGPGVAEPEARPRKRAAARPARRGSAASSK
ncbi:MAG TPA: helix-turn-helix domain-containing protein [Polyangiaceae bacterium]|jgi:transcriptional regulator with XRE-family HTH domain